MQDPMNSIDEQKLSYLENLPEDKLTVSHIIEYVAVDIGRRIRIVEDKKYYRKIMEDGLPDYNMQDKYRFAQIEIMRFLIEKAIREEAAQDILKLKHIIKAYLKNLPEDKLTVHHIIEYVEININECITIVDDKEYYHKILKDKLPGHNIQDKYRVTQIEIMRFLLEKAIREEAAQDILKVKHIIEAYTKDVENACSGQSLKAQRRAAARRASLSVLNITTNEAIHTKLRQMFRRKLEKIIHEYEESNFYSPDLITDIKIFVIDIFSIVTDDETKVTGDKKTRVIAVEEKRLLEEVGRITSEVMIKFTTMTYHKQYNRFYSTLIAETSFVLSPDEDVLVYRKSNAKEDGSIVKDILAMLNALADLEGILERCKSVSLDSEELQAALQNITTLLDDEFLYYTEGDPIGKPQYTVIACQAILFHKFNMYCGANVTGPDKITTWNDRIIQILRAIHRKYAVWREKEYDQKALESAIPDLNMATQSIIDIRKISKIEINALMYSDTLFLLCQLLYKLRGQYKFSENPMYPVVKRFNELRAVPMTIEYTASDLPHHFNNFYLNNIKMLKQCYGVSENYHLQLSDNCYRNATLNEIVEYAYYYLDNDNLDIVSQKILELHGNIDESIEVPPRYASTYQKIIDICQKQLERLSEDSNTEIKAEEVTTPSLTPSP